MKMEIKDLASIIFASTTVIIALYNFRSSRFRVKLKDDLDILKRYREEFGQDISLKDDKSYFCLCNKIKHRMNKAYVLHRTDMSDVVTGVAFICLAILPWTIINLLFIDWRLKAVLSVLFVLVAGYYTYMGFKDRGKERC